jgi:uncharacterized protein YbaA (DUF1428 family)
VAEDVKKGKLTSFPQSVLLKRGEIVIFAWVVYKSRKDRDRVMKAVMTDPRMEMMQEVMTLCDGKRMIYGGFEALVTL